MPQTDKSKQHVMASATLITLGTILISVVALILLTKYNISSYPITILPSEEFCINGFFPFTNHYKVESYVPITTRTNGYILLGKYKLLSKQICITPIKLLQQFSNIQLNLSYFNETDWEIFHKKINLLTTSYPSITNMNPTDINNDEVLEYQTEYNNNFIDYSISLGDNSIPCAKENIRLACDISGLNLTQGASYKLSLFGIYEGQIIQEFGPMEVNVLPAVEIINSTVTNGSIIQTLSLPSITLTLNKAIEDDYTVTFEDTHGNAIPFSFQTIDQTIKLSILESLTQNTSYDIRIKNINGKDGSHYIGEYLLQFSVSDGPKIKYTNLGAGFSTSANIILTFDQNIEKSQNIKHL
jgi:hypothetical protein